MNGVLVHLAFGQLAASRPSSTCQAHDIQIPHGASFGAALATLNETFSALVAANASRPWACVFIKEGSGVHMDACHRAGAATLFEVIDNDRRTGVFPFGHKSRAELAPQVCCAMPCHAML